MLSPIQGPEDSRFAVVTPGNLQTPIDPKPYTKSRPKHQKWHLTELPAVFNRRGVAGLGGCCLAALCAIAAGKLGRCGGSSTAVMRAFPQGLEM